MTARHPLVKRFIKSDTAEQRRMLQGRLGPTLVAELHAASIDKDANAFGELARAIAPLDRGPLSDPIRPWVVDLMNRVPANQRGFLLAGAHANHSGPLHKVEGNAGRGQEGFTVPELPWWIPNPPSTGMGDIESGGFGAGIADSIQHKHYEALRATDAKRALAGLSDPADVERAFDTYLKTIYWTWQQQGTGDEFRRKLLAAGQKPPEGYVPLSGYLHGREQQRRAQREFPPTHAWVRPTPPAVRTTPLYRTHKVRYGDRVHYLADDYGATDRRGFVSDVRQLNPGIDFTRLRVGQVIKVPDTGVPPRLSTPYALRRPVAPRLEQGYLRRLWDAGDRQRRNAGAASTLGVGRTKSAPKPPPVLSGRGRTPSPTIHAPITQGPTSPGRSGNFLRDLWQAGTRPGVPSTATPRFTPLRPPAPAAASRGYIASRDIIDRPGIGLDRVGAAANNPLRDLWRRGNGFGGSPRSR